MQYDTSDTNAFHLLSKSRGEESRLKSGKWKAPSVINSVVMKDHPFFSMSQERSTKTTTNFNSKLLDSLGKCFRIVLFFELVDSTVKIEKARN